ncbi:TniB family NTP-binding protein [Rhodococcus pyridinivorans]|uniref:TniB family NTP-binding protein n=1 Tax=Rhodococcus pyridinivorans TaxID=103816 RepID=UPI00200B18D1|nr:TniB family NTP-binding protein [Rhodococcus pyridinivorans]UPW04843.1 TniB family NTP-binding protein [Rhodococcus pyridinivorans]
MRPDPKNTLTGLRQRLDHRFIRPDRLDRDAYRALDADQRWNYDSRRLQWFGAGFWLKTADTMELLRSVKDYLRTTHEYAVGERNIVLDGPANVGKTTMLLRLAREVEMAQARLNPAYRRHGHVPVVYIEVAPRSTPKMIAAAILDFFGTPVGERRTQRELVGNATDLMLARGTRLLIVDELQMLRLHGPHGDDAMDTLKSIINNAGVVTVLAGIDLTGKLASRAAEQIMGRGETRPLRPFSYASDADRDRWAALLLRFSEEMHLVDSEPERLVQFADPLHALTEGRIGNLRRVLSRALSVAIDEKHTPDAPEEILEEHIFGAAGAAVVSPRADTKKGRSEVA